jgi:hypothetical protein
MLKIKLIILGKFAINKNHFKDFIKVLRKVAINFNKRVKEVAKALTILKY